MDTLERPPRVDDVPVEAVVPRVPLAHRGRVLPIPAESGRPETSKEFAQRIRRVVLRGPRQERQEGGSQPEVEPVDNAPAGRENLEDAPIEEGASTPPSEPRGLSVPPDEFPRISDEMAGQFLTHLSKDTEGIDLPGVVRDRYSDSEDQFFATILVNP